MKPLKNDLGHSGSRFLDVWDKTLFDYEVMRHISILLGMPTANMIYSPIKEPIYQDLWDYIWLIH